MNSMNYMNSFISFGSVLNLPEDPGFATYFTYLYKTQTYIDVTFKIDTSNGEEEVHAHQLILAMRSPHFADMFYGKPGNPITKQHQVIDLGRVNMKAFDDMIRFCYGCRPGLESTEEALALFKVANAFKVTSLLSLCRTCLRGTPIKPDNVFSMLEVSEYTEDKSLRDKCYKLIQEKTREVLAFYELQDVTPVMVHTILDLPKLSFLSEYELIKWLFEWGKVKSGERNSSYDNSKQYLEKLLQDMNFLALTFEEFAALCKDYPDMFSSDEIASIFMNIAFPGQETWEMPDWYDKDVKIRMYTGSQQ